MPRRRYRRLGHLDKKGKCEICVFQKATRVITGHLTIRLCDDCFARDEELEELFKDWTDGDGHSPS